MFKNGGNMSDLKFKLLENRYVGMNENELRILFADKIKSYEKMMKVLKPVSFGADFLYNEEVPLWVKIAHIDEVLECPYCLEEYEQKLNGTH